MSTPAKRTRSRAAKAPSKPARSAKDKPSTARAKKTAGRSPGRTPGGRAPSAARGHRGHEHEHEHDVTVTIPVDRAATAAAKAVSLPVTTAQRVLPAKGGLPLYLGLGALGVVGALEWPVAVGIGVGYAVLRRGGALNPRATTAAE